VKEKIGGYIAIFTDRRNFWTKEKFKEIL